MHQRSRSTRTSDPPRHGRTGAIGKIAYYAIDDEHVRELVATGFLHVAEAAR